jgi:hypothetical protein
LESEKIDLVFNIEELWSETMDLHQNFCVVLEKPDLTDESEVMLSAIFKSVNVDFASQVKILALEGNKKIRIFDILPPSAYLFLMGINPEKIGFTMPLLPYQFSKINNINILVSGSLLDLKTNLEAKKKLWNCLKSHFLQ